jgi:hypothetical protein
MEQVKAPQTEDIKESHTEKADWRGGHEQVHRHHLGGVYAARVQKRSVFLPFGKLNISYVNSL